MQSDRAIVVPFYVKKTKSLVLFQKAAFLLRFPQVFAAGRSNRSCLEGQVRVQKCSSFAKFLQLSGSARLFHGFVWCAVADALQSFPASHTRLTSPEMHEATDTG